MFFKPRRWLGVLVGLSVVAGSAFISVLMARRLAQEPLSLTTLAVGGITLALVIMALLFTYWCYGCFTLHYYLDRNRLTIRWAFIRQYIPLHLIQSLIRGEDLPNPSRIKGVSWPGHHVGIGWVEGLGDTLFYTTHRSLGELLYVVTPSMAYAISVIDPVEFASEIQKRKHLGPLEPSSTRARRWPLEALPFWRDPVVQSLLFIAFVLNLALFSYVFYLLPSLPTLTPTHLTPTGSVTQVGWRWELVTLPANAFFLLASDTFLGIFSHDKERLLTYLFLGTGLLIQVLFWVAAVRLMT